MMITTIIIDRFVNFSRGLRLTFVGCLLGVSMLSLPASAQAPPVEVPFGVIVSEQAQASFSLIGAGARAVAMGGAFTAIADDATAASFNPAGLAQLLVTEASLVVDQRSVGDDFLGFTSFDQEPPLPLTDSAADFSRIRLNFFSVTIPKNWSNRRWVFQLSSQEVVDFTYRSDLEFSETSLDGVPLFNLRQRTRQAGGIRLFSASAAFEATQRVHLGMTVNRWDGDWTFVSENAETPVGGGETESFLFSQSNTLNGWNVDLGVLLRYPHLQVGLRYRVPFDASYRINATLETELPTDLSPLTGIRTDLRWPGTLSAGLAVRPNDFWTLAIDWSQTDWQQMTYRLPSGEEVSFFDLVEPGQSQAAEANTWRLGVERLFLHGTTVFPLRAGFFVEPQPLSDPVTGDRMETTGWSVGAGIKRGPLSFDVAIVNKSSDTQISRFLEPDEIVDGVLRATSIGRRERSETLVLVSTIVQVPKGSQLARLFHRLFIGPVEPAAP